MRRAVAAAHPLWQLLLILGFSLIVLDLVGVIDQPGGLGWSAAVVGSVLGSVILLSIGPKAANAGPDSVAAPVSLAAPVRGTWLAVNSPGQQIPSHGTRALGQLSAADLVQPDDPQTAQVNPPIMRRGLRGSRAELYRCFGAPICAMASDTVVEVADVQPDQRARNTWPSMAWFFTAENILRTVLGWRAVVGNRVVIKHDDGVYSAYVHLKRGSAEVSVGQRVQQGQVIAAVGNTGNSTQPHLHVQLMDRARFPAAAGLPMMWANIELGGIDPVWQKYANEPEASALESMPRNGQVFSA